MGNYDGSQGILAITPENVHRISSEIDSMANDFRSSLMKLDDQIHELLGPGWKGQPAGQFHDAFGDWHKGSIEIVEGMVTIVSALHQVAASLYHGDQMD
ncbi:WXG100 family type VII secretion target [Gordonia sp. DT219]|uniref:WXG100 family type VII secretion target n=1 Tax=Gordonia sp. DT219 TaxID=3416658 RepID=UPI003CF46BF2